MKKLLTLFVLLGGVGLVSCSTVDQREENCIEYKSAMEVVERCTPLYGTLVCVAKEVPRVWCVLYEENDN